ncbi:1-aminocyclopropane-1-carboxylate deaminase [Francisellaceae bacterium CB300]
MRDDLSHPIFSGNKARKLAYILNSPEKYSHIEKIVSFGGNQSNFMLALSQLAKMMNWEFEYWIKPLPKFLRQNSSGNFQLAIENNMKVFETSKELNLENIKREYLNLVDSEMSVYFFDQGGRSQDAEIGIKECAFEIEKYCKALIIDNYSVVIASGTGTTALYLEKYLHNKVYTIACVGDDKYLLQQMNSVDANLNKPEILTKKFESNFGQLDITNYETQQKLLAETDIEFDLLYDPIAWRVLLANYNELPKPIIYIHCGGTSGNISMIKRYERMLNSARSSQ